jgi:hypothetical protein
MHHIHEILHAVIHDLPIGVDLWRMHPEALRLIGSTTTRWRDLGRGLLLIAAGPWALGKLLPHGRETTRGSIDILTMLRATLITMRHFLQEHRIVVSTRHEC